MQKSFSFLKRQQIVRRVSVNPITDPKTAFFENKIDTESAFYWHPPLRFKVTVSPGPLL